MKRRTKMTCDSCGGHVLGYGEIGPLPDEVCECPEAVAILTHDTIIRVKRGDPSLSDAEVRLALCQGGA